MKRKFDYFVEYPPHKDQIATWLNNLGQDGWELVSDTKYGYIFKREIFEASEETIVSADDAESK